MDFYFSKEEKERMINKKKIRDLNEQIKKIHYEQKNMNLEKCSFGFSANMEKNRPNFGLMYIQVITNLANYKADKEGKIKHCMLN